MKIPTVENSLLVMIDLQQKLLPVIHEADSVVKRNALMLKAAAELNLDVIVTEQYPKGLGPTTPELAELLTGNMPVVAKSSFSVFGEPEFCRQLAMRKREVLIFSGIEADICLLQSVIDARSQGYEVIVLADAVSSRKPENCQCALQAARDCGAVVLGCESVLFMLLRDAANPAFKAVSKLVK